MPTKPSEVAKVVVPVVVNSPVIVVSPAKVMVVPVAVMLPEVSMANLAVVTWSWG